MRIFFSVSALSVLALTALALSALPHVAELNIGHFIIGEAIFRGLGPAIVEMRKHMDAAREGLA